MYNEGTFVDVTASEPMISARLGSMQDQSLLELEMDSQGKELCFTDNDSLTPEARQNLTRTRTSSDDKNRTSETSHMTLIVQQMP